MRPAIMGPSSAGLVSSGRWPFRVPGEERPAIAVTQRRGIDLGPARRSIERHAQRSPSPRPSMFSVCGPSRPAHRVDSKDPPAPVSEDRVVRSPLARPAAAASMQCQRAVRSFKCGRETAAEQASASRSNVRQRLVPRRSHQSSPTVPAPGRASRPRPRSMPRRPDLRRGRSACSNSVSGGQGTVREGAPRLRTTGLAAGGEDDGGAPSTVSPSPPAARGQAGAAGPETARLPILPGTRSRSFDEPRRARRTRPRWRECPRAGHRRRGCRTPRNWRPGETRSPPRSAPWTAWNRPAAAQVVAPMAVVHQQGIAVVNRQHPRAVAERTGPLPAPPTMTAIDLHRLHSFPRRPGLGGCVRVPGFMLGRGLYNLLGGEYHSHTKAPVLRKWWNLALRERC